jgi:hypothetical protein
VGSLCKGILRNVEVMLISNAEHSGDPPRVSLYSSLQLIPAHSCTLLTPSSKIALRDVVKDTFSDDKVLDEMIDRLGIEVRKFVTLVKRDTMTCTLRCRYFRFYLQSMGLHTRLVTSSVG